MTEEMLDIVDENDNVIGTASRHEAHAKGLLHREISILFVTPAGDVIFQRRSKTKATNPGLLAFTVAGHVIAGDSYDQALLKEAEEETGLKLNLDDLVLLEKDMTTYPTNNCHRRLYGYIFRDSIDTLRIEPEDGDGFVAIARDHLFNIPDYLLAELDTPYLNPAQHAPIYKKLLDLVK